MSRAWLEALPRFLRTPGQSATWENALKRWTISQPSQRASRLATRSFHGRSAQFRTRQAFSPPRIGLRQTQQRGFRFTAWRRNAGNGTGSEKSLSLSERFRKLTREYGRAAVAIYFILSVLDMPFFFLLVRSVGTELIGDIEHRVLSTVKAFIPESVRNKVSGAWDAVTGLFKSKNSDAAEATEGWGVEEAQERHNQEASLGTQLALAYAVHKSFIFFRIPLTIAITPRIVKQLRAWGWNIGKKLVKRS